MSNENDLKTIKILNSLVLEHKKLGLKEVFEDCNVFGNPALNLTYLEVYQCCVNGQVLLALAGAGIFLENFTSELWVSSQTRNAQLAGKFSNWDEVMAFHEASYESLESKEILFEKDIRPILQKILESEDFKALGLLRDFIRNTFVHSKRSRLLKSLQENGVIGREIPVGRATYTAALPKIDTVKMTPTHPLIRNLGFKILAKQLAPAMLIFIFKMFKKYHKFLAPLEDRNIKFSGHRCEYD